MPLLACCSTWDYLLYNLSAIVRDSIPTPKLSRFFAVNAGVETTTDLQTNRCQVALMGLQYEQAPKEYSPSRHYLFQPPGFVRQS
jgi:hypothetical protein